MKPYCNHVSGFFAHREGAATAIAGLVAFGLPDLRLHLLDAGSTPADPTGG